MKIHRLLLTYRGAVLFAVMQAAPVDVHLRENGRFGIAFGVGGDSYEQAQYGCDGSTLESRRISARTTSGAVNVPIGAKWSVEAFGGATQSDSPVCADSACTLPPAFKGGFGGVRFIVDGGDAALGIGAVDLPDVDIDYMNSTHRVTRVTMPSVMLRVGTLAPGRKHFRVELNGIPAPGSPPMTTFGFGGHAADSTPARFFVGLAVPSYSAAENGNLLLRAELGVPVGPHALLTIAGAGNSSIFAGSGGIRLRW